MRKKKQTELAQLLLRHRGTKGLREAGAEMGLSATTLSRIENGQAPDLESFTKICKWLSADPAAILGLRREQNMPVQVHVRTNGEIHDDFAVELSRMILAAQRALACDKTAEKDWDA